jgi:hypothetical protein
MSLVAKSFTIFRKTTDAGGNPGTDLIIFNNAADGDFKDSTKEGAYIITLQRGDPEGIGNNQAAEVDDGNVQPLGIVEGTYIVKGFITNMRGNSDDGDNTIVALLRTWKEEAQVILNELEAGRFGIIDASDTDNNLIPIGTGNTAIGLIFENFSKINDYNRNRVEVTLTFRRSRGITI